MVALRSLFLLGFKTAAAANELQKSVQQATPGRENRLRGLRTPENLEMPENGSGMLPWKIEWVVEYGNPELPTKTLGHLHDSLSPISC